MIVRLKGFTISAVSPTFAGFNSMIVRLKERSKYCYVDIDVTFQFYDSPIKSPTPPAWSFFLYGFQFYDSPIKSSIEKLVKLSKERFQFYDSPIKSVRLRTPKRPRRVFQFYDSPIKRDGTFQFSVFHSCFNSMIVRLKVSTFRAKG